MDTVALSYLIVVILLNKGTVILCVVYFQKCVLSIVTSWYEGNTIIGVVTLKTFKKSLPQLTYRRNVSNFTKRTKVSSYIYTISLCMCYSQIPVKSFFFYHFSESVVLHKNHHYKPTMPPPRTPVYKQLKKKLLLYFFQSRIKTT